MFRHGIERCSVVMKLKISLLLVLAAMALALLDISLVGFSIALVYCVSIIIFGGRFGYLKPGRELGILLVVPQVIFLILLCLERKISGAISYMSGIFDIYFSNVFLGIQTTSHDLYLGGYAARSSSIKGYAIIALSLTLIFSWRYMAVCVAYRSAKPRKQNVSMWQASQPYVILVPMFIFGVFGVDMYTPTCQSRCSGIQHSNFIGMNWFMAQMVCLSILLDMWLTTLTHIYNSENTADKEHVNEQV
jgi:hypothetical protein